MNLYNTVDKKIYNLDIPAGNGEYYSTCPTCSHLRKQINQKQKCLSFNRNQNIGYCNHCGGKFIESNIEFKDFKSKELKVTKLQTIPHHLIDRYIGNQDHFVDYLYNLFKDKPIYRERIKKTINDYWLCSTRDGNTIFLQIDKEFRIRTGQIIDYNPITGKRRRGNACLRPMENAPTVNWVHKQRGIRENLGEDFAISQCYFGEHLLGVVDYKSTTTCRDMTCHVRKTIIIVESPKTAIIGSIISPSCIWMATMGKEGLKAEKTIALKGRDIILIPDLDAYELWVKKAKTIEDETGLRISINPIIQNRANAREIEEKWDIADYLIRDLG